jgi:photosystem II stability/assembly factor-like uncharacterized protein
MKNFLLLFSLLFSFLGNSQTFWVEKATGFLNAGTNQTRISYADANTAWFYATDGSGAQETYQQWGRTIDGGETWTNGTIVMPNASYSIGDICATSATTAYVSVFPAVGSTIQGGIWKTTDAGVTWNKQTTASYNTGTDSFANIVYFFDENNGLTMGDPAGGYFEIYTTTNAGVNWTRVPSANIPAPLAGEYGYTNNSTANGDVLWFGTNKGRLFKTTNRGLNWTVSQTPSTDFGTGNRGTYAFQDVNNGILILQDHGYYRTTDGGVTWVSEVPNDGALPIYRNFCVEYVPGTANTYVTTGEIFEEEPTANPPRGSAYSTDGGLNWVDINEVDVVPNNGANSLSFFDATHGLGGGFTDSEVAGGIWKWVNDASTLSKSSFTTTKYFTASPNPTSGIVTIAGKGISNVVITDVLGKQVANTNFTSVETATIDMSSYNAGIYLVKVTNANGNASTIKVVRQ